MTAFTDRVASTAASSLSGNEELPDSADGSVLITAEIVDLPEPISQSGFRTLVMALVRQLGLGRKAVTVNGLECEIIVPKKDQEMAMDKIQDAVWIQVKS